MGSITPQAKSSPAVPAGIYCPSITFFENTPEQEVDYSAQAAHTRFLIESGVHGITIHGTTGEAPLLSRAERNKITKLISDIKAELGASTTLSVGCSAQSVKETVLLCEEAKENGGEFALVLPPSYWRGASDAGMIEGFYNSVADRSPIPVIVYSFPAVTQGVDMDSDLLLRLAAHPNIVGVKLTCGNAGKLTRLTHALPASTFSVFGGSTDWLLPGLIAHSCGAVTGLANTHPRSVVRLFNLFEQGRIVEAQELQGRVSAAEWAMGKTGMAGTKYAVESVGAYKKKVLPRQPLVESSEETKKWIRETMRDLTEYEVELARIAEKSQA